ncbi:hypothetical protein TELCIR_15167, partial [Teladorsagia circumcincta]
MFASDWHLALAACGITFTIYKYVEWKGAKKEWGDGMRGLALSTAQYSLMKVEDKDPHPKNWRPQLLICLSTHWSKELLDLRAMSMLNLAAQLKVWRGCTLRIFAIGDNDPTKNEEIRKGLQKYIYMLRIDADVFMVELLDTEVSDEVVEKTAELEKQQQKLESIRNQIRRSRSRESGFINDAYNNDDTITSRKQLKL